MAKGKDSKAEQRRQRAHGLERDTYMGFMDGVAEKKSELDDAQTAHAGAWKGAEPRGIHPDVAKVCAKLDRMEPTKRRDWLRSFDTYRPWYDWEDQPDMFDDAVHAAEASERQETEREPAEHPLDFTDRPSSPPPSSEEVLKEQEEEEPVDETAAEATEETAAAGFTFAAGRDAGERGEPLESNPHPESTVSHPIWARGHAQGVANEAEASAEGETVVSMTTGRRARRAAAEAEAGAAVH